MSSRNLDENVSGILHAGEDVQRRIENDSATLVVTSHRLLVVTPEGPGANLRAIQRPNVDGVSWDRRGTGWLLTGGMKALVLGGVGLLGSFVVDFDTLFGGVDPQGLGAVGAGGLISLIQGLVTVVSMLDVVLFGAGAALIVIGIGAVAGYWLTRESVLVVSVAGNDDVHLETTQFRPGDADRLRSALSAK